MRPLPCRASFLLPVTIDFHIEVHTTTIHSSKVLETSCELQLQMHSSGQPLLYKHISAPSVTFFLFEARRLIGKDSIDLRLVVVQLEIPRSHLGFKIHWSQLCSIMTSSTNRLTSGMKDESALTENLQRPRKALCKTCDSMCGGRSVLSGPGMTDACS